MINGSLGSNTLCFSSSLQPYTRSTAVVLMKNTNMCYLPRSHKWESFVLSLNRKLCTRCGQREERESLCVDEVLVHVCVHIVNVCAFMCETTFEPRTLSHSRRSIEEEGEG